MSATLAGKTAMNETLTSELFGDGAVLVTANIHDYRRHLHAAELALVDTAIDKRVREFSTGRYCARLALQKLGVEPQALLIGKQREPLWPKGVVGSISHCRDLAGAVVAEKSNTTSLGFDVENRKQLDPRIARHVCTPDEKIWLGTQHTDRQNLALLLIFSLKEAMFKCVYQARGIALRFQQCNALPRIEDNSASITVDVPELGLDSEKLRVRYALSNTHVYSGVSWYP